MRIALLLPYFWPEVYRGTERIAHDIGVQMVERGHRVTLLTTHLASTDVALEGGMEIIRSRRPPYVSPLRWYEDHLEGAPAVTARLLRGHFDLAIAFVPAYAWAAVKVQGLGGPPVVLCFHGIPDRRYLVYCRYRLQMLQTTLARAAAVTVLSKAAARAFNRYLMIDPVVLPAGYFPEDFEVEVERAPEPTLVCAASLTDPRKRGPLLLRAFEALRRSRPETRLHLIRPAGTAPPSELGRLPDGAGWHLVDGKDGVGRAFGAAWASVLPSVGEAQGLVLIESLAAGTPVVAARDGAGPEIVSDQSIGHLFEPDDEASLTEAMDRALTLAGRSGTRSTCRDHVARFQWSALIEAHERVFIDAAKQGGAS